LRCSSWPDSFHSRLWPSSIRTASFNSANTHSQSIFPHSLLNPLITSTAMLLSRMTPTRADRSRTLHLHPRRSPHPHFSPRSKPAQFSNPTEFFSPAQVSSPAAEHATELPRSFQPRTLALLRSSIRSLPHSSTLSYNSSRKSEPLTPLFSAASFHSFHSFLTLFRLTPVFATLTKAIIYLTNQRA